MIPSSEDYLKTANGKYSGKIPDPDSRSPADFFQTVANNLACILLNEGKTPSIFSVVSASRPFPVCVAEGKVYDPRTDRAEPFTNYVKREKVQQTVPAAQVPDWLESA